MQQSTDIKKLSKSVTAGATDFANYGKGTDPQKIFRKLVEDARYEHGSGGYTGTIAEKGGDGLKILSTPMTYEKAKEYAYERTERMSKDGPTWAIPISEEKVIKEQEIALEIRAKTSQDALTEFKKTVIEKLKLKADESVIFAREQAKKNKEGSPPVTEKFKSNPIVKFQVYHNNLAIWSGHTFSDKGAASKEAEKLLNSDQIKVGDTIEVKEVTYVSKTGVKVASSGAKLPLWTVSAIVKKTQVGNISGYLFFGVASD